ncbi:MAG: response regulator transcription factor [Xanthomonadales bacterium]|nr:response regulator transcription factor [Xanthomonadales bacterium]
MRILLIEDDESLGEGLRTALRRAALTVDWLRDGVSALAALRDGGIDLAVLDLGLPQMDGMEVIRQARRAGVTTPILVLSARERPADRALGLDAGADDYLGKPFDTAELLARVRALLRRTGGRAQPTLRMGALELDPSRLEVVWRGRPLDLPRREFALLRLLMEQRGRPISRESAQQRLYGWDEDVSSNALDVHVHALRKKLDPALIRTLRGVGYALDERVAADPPEGNAPA